MPFVLSSRAESYLIRLSSGEREAVKDQLLHRLIDTKQIMPGQNRQANDVLVIQAKILLRESLTVEEETFKARLDRSDRLGLGDVSGVLAWSFMVAGGIGLLALVAFLLKRKGR